MLVISIETYIFGDFTMSFLTSNINNDNYFYFSLFSVEEILEDLKAADPEDPVYALNQELTR